MIVSTGEQKPRGHRSLRGDRRSSQPAPDPIPRVTGGRRYVKRPSTPVPAEEPAFSAQNKARNGIVSKWQRTTNGDWSRTAPGNLKAYAEDVPRSVFAEYVRSIGPGVTLAESDEGR